MKQEEDSKQPSKNQAHTKSVLCRMIVPKNESPLKTRRQRIIDTLQNVVQKLSFLISFRKKWAPSLTYFEDLVIYSKSFLWTFFQQLFPYIKKLLLIYFLYCRHRSKNHKLIHWRFVVQNFIDYYSPTGVYGKFVAKNKAETVISHEYGPTNENINFAR